MSQNLLCVSHSKKVRARTTKLMERREGKNVQKESAPLPKSKDQKKSKTQIHTDQLNIHLNADGMCITLGLEAVCLGL